MWWQVILGVCAIFKCRFSNYCIGEYWRREMSYQSAHTATRVFLWNLTHDCCQERRRLLQQRPQKTKWLESAICNAFCVLVFKLFGVQGIVVDIVLMCSAEIIGILWLSDLQVVFRFPFCWNFNFWFINPTYIKNLAAELPCLVTSPRLLKRSTRLPRKKVGSRVQGLQLQCASVHIHACPSTPGRSSPASYSFSTWLPFWCVSIGSAKF